MTSPAYAPRPARHPALVAVDIIASVVLILFTVSLALVTITAAVSFQGLTADCGPGPFGGVTCNNAVLGATTVGMIVVAVVAAFLGTGFVIVNIIRKRYAFYWPVAAALVIIAASWIGTWIVGMVAP